MKLKEIVSCYVSKDYLCNVGEFAQIVLSFEKNAENFEGADWRKFKISDSKVTYKRGRQLCLEFDYSGEKLEVQVHFEYFDKAGKMKVSVGNSGFPFEPLLSKSRYSKLLEKLHEFVDLEYSLKLA